MDSGEILYNLSKYVLVTISAVASIYGGYWAYYAYFKAEDEEKKNGITNAIAKAFGTSVLLFLLYYVIQVSVKAANVEQLSRLWKLLHFGNNGDFSVLTAISVMMVVLGVFLFIDQRDVHLRR